MSREMLMATALLEVERGFEGSPDLLADELAEELYPELELDHRVRWRADDPNGREREILVEFFSAPVSDCWMATSDDPQRDEWEAHASAFAEIGLTQLYLKEKFGECSGMVNWTAGGRLEVAHDGIRSDLSRSRQAGACAASEAGQPRGR